MNKTRVGIACAAIAVAVAGIAVVATLSVHDWRVSALVHMSAEEPMSKIAREADPGFEFVHFQSHYDGVYFYAIAVDPLARDEAHTLIDAAPYRYGHAGYGWLAWLASGGGNAAAVPAALLAVGLAGVAVAAYATSLLARELGWSSWAGMIVALSPGAIYAVTADTSEPVALAATAFALLAWARRRWAWAAVALVAACLIKEPLLLVPTGLAVWESIRVVRGDRAPELGRRALAILAGPIAFGAWAIYLNDRLGTWPFTHPSEEFLVAPFTGWVDSLRRAARLAAGPFDASQIGNASVVLLTIIGAALLIGMIRALRFRSWLDPIFLMDALLIFSLNWLGLLYPKDLIRETTVPLLLLPAVLLSGRDPDRPAGMRSR
ncbi:MAG: AZOBR_p60025 family cell surface glycopolymer formation protein [Actinomycetota bacterium]